MPCLAAFFDTMSGVKKFTTFVPAINCPLSEFEPSFDDFTFLSIYNFKTILETYFLNYAKAQI